MLLTKLRTACLLAINTGELVKGLRARQHDERAERRAAGLARRRRRARPARAGLRAGGPPGKAGARGGTAGADVSKR